MPRPPEGLPSLDDRPLTPTESSQSMPLVKALRQDWRRSLGAAVVACTFTACVDLVLTVVTAPAGVGFGVGARLLCLHLTLFTLLIPVGTLLLGGMSTAARIAVRAQHPARSGLWPGLLSPASDANHSRAAPWLWGIAFSAIGFAFASTWLTLDFSTRFKEPQAAALLLAMFQLGLFAAFAAVGFVIGVAIRRVGQAVDSALGGAAGFNPLSRVWPALVPLSLLILGSLKLVVLRMPHLAPLIPWRHLIALLAATMGVRLYTHVIARRGHLLPVQRQRRLIAISAILFGATVMVPVTLVRIGAHAETKGLAIAASPPATSLIALIRRANDFDGDGYGSLLGGNDCGPFDAEINPLARDVPDNGVDENCNGRDFQLGQLPSYKLGERVPLPDAFKRDWNFLLITVDTVRYDHTGFGGYKRDTTPNLDELVARSVSFAFCQAPSAGTMASVPAILTSRFFHSGIALDEKRARGMPPILKPENTLIGEVMQRGGYTTGAILSHYYFNKWGMEQGFDTYDNTIGAKNQPRAVTSDKLTDRALAWIGAHDKGKWFLWVHYLDPHGYYVPHPGEKSYGETEMDLYDGELRFTDKHLGRLLDELSRTRGAGRTVVIITSDHGDGFNEHGFINHGSALYREILHVPLIFMIPDNEPRIAQGAVSPLDILPTMADLAAIDIDDLSIEGHSLLPQLLYGRDTPERVVFAETNYRNTLRAAVTSQYKLIHNIEANVFKLYDLAKDPWEKKDISRQNPKALTLMKGYLDDWLDRVFYARDQGNQVMFKLRDVLVDDPAPQHTLTGVSLDGGRLSVLGFDTDKQSYRPGETVKVAVYLRVDKRPSANFKFQIEGWWGDPADKKTPARFARSPMRMTSNGMFPTTRWEPGEVIRDRFTLRLPARWAPTRPEHLALGIKLGKAKAGGTIPASSGPTRPGDTSVAVLGDVGLVPVAPADSPEAPKPGAAPLRKKKP